MQRRLLLFFARYAGSDGQQEAEVGGKTRHRRWRLGRRLATVQDRQGEAGAPCRFRKATRDVGCLAERGPCATADDWTGAFLAWVNMTRADRRCRVQLSPAYHAGAGRRPRFRSGIQRMESNTRPAPTGDCTRPLSIASRRVRRSTTLPCQGRPQTLQAALDTDIYGVPSIAAERQLKPSKRDRPRGSRSNVAPEEASVGFRHGLGRFRSASRGS